VRLQAPPLPAFCGRAADLDGPASSAQTDFGPLHRRCSTVAACLVDVSARVYRIHVCYGFRRD
jgi:hypothetical protein